MHIPTALALLLLVSTASAAVIEKTNIHVLGPQRGSFAVYCQIPPGLLHKRSDIVSEKTIVAGPAMRGSFVFYGCCPDGQTGIAEKVDAATADVVPSTIDAASISNYYKSVTKVAQGPLRGSFVFFGCPPGYTP